MTCSSTCLPTWPASHPIELCVAKTRPRWNWPFDRRRWTREPWWQNWQNDGRVTALGRFQPRWHDATLRLKPSQYYPQPRDPSIDAIAHWIEPAPRHRSNGVVCQLHIELKERTTSGAASHLLPPVKRSVQQGVLSVFFITEVIEYIVRHDRRDNLNFPAPDTGFYMPKNTWYHMIVRRVVERTQVMVRWGAFIDQKTRDITWSSGDWWKGLKWGSGEGFDEQEEDLGWTPHGY